MSSEFLERSDILKHLEGILSVQEKISEYVHNRICVSCDDLTDENWDVKRKEAFKFIRGLIDKYAFSRKVPRDETGIMTQSIISHLLNIQHTFLRVLVRLDMLQDETFNEIFMDALTTISTSVKEMITALKLMINQRASKSSGSEDTLELIIKLERQIDEDNIIICRQISVATGDETDFPCYMMRKIVADLEHISDYVKECAEIVSEI
jgi:hypothetical protein